MGLVRQVTMASEDLAKLQSWLRHDAALVCEVQGIMQAFHKNPNGFAYASLMQQALGMITQAYEKAGYPVKEN